MDEAEMDEAEGYRDALLAWISASCEPVKRRRAMKILEFRRAAADSIGVCLTQIGPFLRAVGIDPKGVPNSLGDRVAVGPHPDWTRIGPAPGLRVKCSERDSDDAEESTPSVRSEVTRWRERERRKMATHRIHAQQACAVCPGLRGRTR